MPLAADLFKSSGGDYWGRGMSPVYATRTQPNALAAAPGMKSPAAAGGVPLPTAPTPISQTGDKGAQLGVVDDTLSTVKWVAVAAIVVALAYVVGRFK